MTSQSLFPSPPSPVPRLTSLNAFDPAVGDADFSRESFLALQTWLADCRALASPDIVIILVGNKSDLSSAQNTSLTTDIRTFANSALGEGFRGGEVTGGFRREREVSVEEAGRWASREGIGFLEASALDGTNVDEAFLRCARQILTKVELGVSSLAMSGS